MKKLFNPYAMSKPRKLNFFARPFPPYITEEALHRRYRFDKFIAKLLSGFILAPIVRFMIPWILFFNYDTKNMLNASYEVVQAHIASPERNGLMLLTIFASLFSFYLYKRVRKDFNAVYIPLWYEHKDFKPLLTSFFGIVRLF